MQRDAMGGLIDGDEEALAGVPLEDFGLHPVATDGECDMPGCDRDGVDSCGGLFLCADHTVDDYASYLEDDDLDDEEFPEVAPKPVVAASAAPRRRPARAPGSVSKRTRFEVFKRDRFTCQYCGRRPPDVMLEADHIHPRCEGGSDDPANLTTACVDCNRGKAGVPLGDVLPSVDEDEALASAQEMLERAAVLRHSVVAAEAQRSAEIDAITRIRTWWKAEWRSTSDIDDGSLRRFLKELAPEQIDRALVATQSRENRGSGLSAYGRWKYFCDVCWTMIREQRG